MMRKLILDDWRIFSKKCQSWLTVTGNKLKSKNAMLSLQNRLDLRTTKFFNKEKINRSNLRVAQCLHSKKMWNLFLVLWQEKEFISQHSMKKVVNNLESPQHQSSNKEIEWREVAILPRWWSTRSMETNGALQKQAVQVYKISSYS